MGYIHVERYEDKYTTDEDRPYSIYNSASNTAEKKCKQSKATDIIRGYKINRSQSYLF